MKRCIILILSVLFLICTFNTSVLANVVLDEVDVYINDEELVTDQKAVTINGRTMVPLRAICEALKCEVTWNDETQTAQIQNEVTIVAVQINNYKLAKVDRDNQHNIMEIKLDVPPIVYNDRTLVPARAIAEALYALVSWNDENHRVDITLEFDFIGSFDEGFARVRKSDKYGFINEARQIVIPIDYDYATYFEGGISYVGKNGKFGAIDINNDIVIPFKYDSINDLMKQFVQTNR